MNESQFFEKIGATGSSSTSSSNSSPTSSTSSRSSSDRETQFFKKLNNYGSSTGLDEEKYNEFNNLYNQYVTDSDALYNGHNSRVGQTGYKSDSKNYYSKTATARAAAQTSSKALADWMNANRSYFTYEDYASIMDSVNQNNTTLNEIVNSARSEANYYSQFKDEDEYNVWDSYQKSASSGTTEEWLSEIKANGENAAARVKELEDAITRTKAAQAQSKADVTNPRNVWGALFGYKDAEKESQQRNETLEQLEAQLAEAKKEVTRQNTLLGYAQDYKQYGDYSNWVEEMKATGKKWTDIYDEAAAKVNQLTNEYNNQQETSKSSKLGLASNIWSTLNSWDISDIIQALIQGTNLNTGLGRQSKLELPDNIGKALELAGSWGNLANYLNEQQSNTASELLDAQRILGYAEMMLPKGLKQQSDYVENVKRGQRRADILSQLDAAHSKAKEQEQAEHPFLNWLMQNDPNSQAGNAYNRYAEDVSYQRPSDQWTTAQIEAWYYYLGKGEAEANAYAERINRMYAEKAEAQKSSEYSKWAYEHPAAGGAGGVALSATLGPISAGIDYLDKAIQYSARGTIMPTGQTNLFDLGNSLVSGSSQYLNEKGVLPEKIPVVGGKGMGDALQLGESIAQSLTWGAIGGPVGSSAAFFASAANSAYDEAKARGVSDGQALAYGAAAGTAEAAFEYLSMDKLIKLKSPDSLRKFFKNALTQAGIEASEELNTTLANTLSDAFINKDKSSFNQSLLQYISDGLSYEDANNKAWREWVNNTAYDALAGFISGGISAGAKMGVETIRNVSNTNRIYGKSTAELVEQGLESPEGTESHRLAEKYKAKLNAGKKLTAEEINNLVRANEEQIRKEESEQQQASQSGTPQNAAGVKTPSEAQEATEAQEDITTPPNPQNDVTAPPAKLNSNSNVEEGVQEQQNVIDSAERLQNTPENDIIEYPEAVGKAFSMLDSGYSRREIYDTTGIMIRSDGDAYNPETGALYSKSRYVEKVHNEFLATEAAHQEQIQEEEAEQQQTSQPETTQTIAETPAEQKEAKPPKEVKPIDEVVNALTGEKVEETPAEQKEVEPPKEVKPIDEVVNALTGEKVEETPTEQKEAVEEKPKETVTEQKPETKPPKKPKGFKERLRSIGRGATAQEIEAEVKSALFDVISTKSAFSSGGLTKDQIDFIGKRLNASTDNDPENDVVRVAASIISNYSNILPLKGAVETTGKGTKETLGFFKDRNGKWRKSPVTYRLASQNGDRRYVDKDFEAAVLQPWGDNPTALNYIVNFALKAACDYSAIPQESRPKLSAYMHDTKIRGVSLENRLWEACQLIERTGYDLSAAQQKNLDERIAKARRSFEDSSLRENDEGDRWYVDGLLVRGYRGEIYDPLTQCILYKADNAATQRQKGAKNGQSNEATSSHEGGTERKGENTEGGLGRDSVGSLSDANARSKQVYQDVKEGEVRYPELEEIGIKPVSVSEAFGETSDADTSKGACHPIPWKYLPQDLKDLAKKIRKNFGGRSLKIVFVTDAKLPDGSNGFLNLKTGRVMLCANSTEAPAATSLRVVFHSLTHSEQDVQTVAEYALNDLLKLDVNECIENYAELCNYPYGKNLEDEKVKAEYRERFFADLFANNSKLNDSTFADAKYAVQYIVNALSKWRETDRSSTFYDWFIPEEEDINAAFETAKSRKERNKAEKAPYDKLRVAIVYNRARTDYNAAVEKWRKQHPDAKGLPRALQSEDEYVKGRAQYYFQKIFNDKGIDKEVELALIMEAKSYDMEMGKEENEKAAFSDALFESKRKEDRRIEDNYTASQFLEDAKPVDRNTWHGHLEEEIARQETQSRKYDLGVMLEDKLRELKEKGTDARRKYERAVEFKGVDNAWHERAVLDLCREEYKDCADKLQRFQEGSMVESEIAELTEKLAKKNYSIPPIDPAKEAARQAAYEAKVKEKAEEREAEKAKAEKLEHEALRMFEEGRNFDEIYKATGLMVFPNGKIYNPSTDQLRQPDSNKASKKHDSDYVNKLLRIENDDAASQQKGAKNEHNSESARAGSENKAGSAVMESLPPHERGAGRDSENGRNSEDTRGGTEDWAGQRSVIRGVPADSEVASPLEGGNGEAYKRNGRSSPASRSLVLKGFPGRAGQDIEEGEVRYPELEQIDIQPVSLDEICGREINIQGATAKNIHIIPEEHLPEDLKALRNEICRRYGEDAQSSTLRVLFARDKSLLGNYADGVFFRDSNLIILCVNAQDAPSKNAFHELFHAEVSRDRSILDVCEFAIYSLTNIDLGRYLRVYANAWQYCYGSISRSRSDYIEEYFAELYPERSTSEPALNYIVQYVTQAYSTYKHLASELSSTPEYNSFNDWFYFYGCENGTNSFDVLAEQIRKFFPTVKQPKVEYSENIDEAKAKLTGMALTGNKRFDYSRAVTLAQKMRDLGCSLEAIEAITGVEFLGYKWEDKGNDFIIGSKTNKSSTAKLSGKIIDDYGDLDREYYEQHVERIHGVDPGDTYDANHVYEVLSLAQMMLNCGCTDNDIRAMTGFYAGPDGGIYGFAGEVLNEEDPGYDAHYYERPKPSKYSDGRVDVDEYDFYGGPALYAPNDSWMDEAWHRILGQDNADSSKNPKQNQKPKSQKPKGNSTPTSSAEYAQQQYQKKKNEQLQAQDAKHRKDVEDYEKSQKEIREHEDYYLDLLMDKIFPRGSAGFSSAEKAWEAFKKRINDLYDLPAEDTPLSDDTAWLLAEETYGSDDHVKIYKATQHAVKNKLFLEEDDFKAHLGEKAEENVEKAVAEFKSKIEGLGTGHVYTEEFAEYYKNLKDNNILGDFYDERVNKQLQRAAEYSADMHAYPGPYEVLRYQHAAVKAIQMVAHHVEKANRVRTQLSELNDAVKVYGSELKPYELGREVERGEKSKSFLTKLGAKLVRLQIMPRQMFQMIDGFAYWNKGPGYKMADAIEEAAVKEQNVLVKANEPFTKVVNMKGYRDFATGKSKSSIELELSNYDSLEEITLSMKDVVTLYQTIRTLGGPEHGRVLSLEGFALENNEKKPTRIWLSDEEKPGEKAEDVSYPVMVRFGRNHSVELYRNEKDLRTFYSALESAIDSDPVAKAYVDAVNESFAYLGEEDQTTAKNIDGTDIDILAYGDYFPVSYFSRQDFNRGWDEEKAQNFGLPDFGNLNERTRNMGGYAMIPDLVKLTDAHIRRSAHYIAFGELADTFSLMDHMHTYGMTTLTQTVTNEMGDEYGTWMQNYIKDVQNLSEKRAKPKNDIWKKISNNFQTAVLVANPGTPFKQKGSLWLAMSELDPRAVAKAAITSLNPRNQQMKDAKKNNSLLRYRALGNIDASISDALKDEDTLLGKAIAKTENRKGVLGLIGKGLKWARGWIPDADVHEVSKIYLASYYDVQMKNPGMSTTSDEFKQLVDKTFQSALMHTQSQYTMNMRDEISRGDSALLKALTMFQTQQRTTANNMLTAIGEAKAAERWSKRRAGGEAKQRLNNAWTGFFASNVAYAAMSVLAAAIRHKLNPFRDDDDDELDAGKIGLELLKYFGEGVGGTVVFGEDVVELMNSIIFGDEYYENSVGAVGAITEIASNAANFFESPSANNVRKFAGSVANVCGLPLNNVYMLLNSMAMWTLDAINGISKGTSAADVAGERKSTLYSISDDPADDILKILDTIRKAANSFAPEQFTYTDEDGEELSYDLTRSERNKYRKDVEKSYNTGMDALLASAGYNELDAKDKKAVRDDLKAHAKNLAEQNYLDGKGLEHDTGAAAWEENLSEEEIPEYLVAKRTLENLIGGNNIDYDAVDDYMEDEINGYGSLTDAQKEALDETNSIAKADSIFEASVLGISAEEWYDAKAKYDKLEETDKETYSNTDKTVEFSTYIDSQGFNKSQEELLKEQFRFWNNFPAEASRYDKLIDAGFSPDVANEVYFDFKDADTDGSGGVTQAEAYEKLSSMSYLTDDERNKIWAIIGTTWKRSYTQWAKENGKSTGDSGYSSGKSSSNSSSSSSNSRVYGSDDVRAVWEGLLSGK